jgi:hypothetical protein
MDHSFRNILHDADLRRPARASLPSTSRDSMRMTLAPRLLILGVCGWSLIETPAEIDPAAGDSGVVALVLAKFVWVVIGVAAARGMKRAQWLFSFLCGLSLVAIVPALPVELNESAWIFTQSLIECLLKAGALLAFAFARVTRAAGAQSTAWNDDDSGIQKP